MSSILLEAYFREHSINVTIVPIGCQMAEISVKNGPIVIKKSYGFDFGGDFCSYVHKREKKWGRAKSEKKFEPGGFN